MWVQTRYWSQDWAPANISPPPTTTIQLYILFFISSESHHSKYARVNILAVCITNDDHSKRRLKKALFLLFQFITTISTAVVNCISECPYLTFGAGAEAHQRWGLNLGPMCNPDRPDGRTNLLRGFCKPQENRPVDTVKSVQWESVITEDRFSEHVITRKQLRSI